MTCIISIIPKKFIPKGNRVKFFRDMMIGKFKVCGKPKMSLKELKFSSSNSPFK